MNNPWEEGENKTTSSANISINRFMLRILTVGIDGDRVLPESFERIN